MRRLDDRTVELNDMEVEISRRFDDHLRDGMGIRDAAHKALAPDMPMLDPTFVAYLSDNTLKVWAGRLVDNNEEAVQSLNEGGPRTYSLTTLVLIGLLGALIGLWLCPVRGYAAEPYGGCDEAYIHPASDGADWCRDHGWVIKYRDKAGDAALVVTPRRILSSTDLQGCKYEDGSGPARLRPCVWWGESSGNGHGLSYWVGRGMGVHYMWPYNPATGKWSWITSAQADALAEGDAPHATTRHWERCVTDSKIVVCPNGYTTNI